MDVTKCEIPYLLTVLLSVLLIKLTSSSQSTSSPATTTTEVIPTNDQCQENGLYYKIDTLKSTIEQANQETKGKIIKYLSILRLDMFTIADLIN